MKPGALQDPGRNDGPEKHDPEKHGSEKHGSEKRGPERHDPGQHGREEPPPERKGVRYSVKFVCGTAGEACGGCAPVRPGAHATQISIHNYSQEKVAIRKHFIPLVVAGAPVGREPAVATSCAQDGIELPPHTATMDDCCRIGELLFGAALEALTIGIMEIVASRDVAVTAVYTTSTAIDVVPVAGHAF